jgi:hypothetical protein
VFINAADATELRTALDLSAVTFTDGDVGLLAVAFPRDFAASGHVYVNYDAAGGPLGHRSRLSRFTSRDGGETFDRFRTATITFGPDGDLDLPIGSVLMKEFSIEGRKIETRLLVRHDDGDWAGYAYA